MYWVNSVLWQLRIGKSLRNSLFQGLVFGLIFRSCKDYFFSFLLTRLLFHRNVIGFQFSAKKIFAKCNCFDNLSDNVFIEIVFIDLNAIMYSKPTRNEYDTFLLKSFLLSLSPKKGGFCKKKCFKVFACSKAEAIKIGPNLLFWFPIV